MFWIYGIEYVIIYTSLILKEGKNKLKNSYQLASMPCE